MRWLSLRARPLRATTLSAVAQILMPSAEDTPPSTQAQTSFSRKQTTIQAAAAPVPAQPAIDPRSQGLRGSVEIMTPSASFSELTAGRVTAISKDRLQTFNFQQATKQATSSGAPNAAALSSDELRRYIGSVLRFVPVEVAMRYYEDALVASDAANPAASRRAYEDLSHEVCVLGDQGYEHPCDACVLFSDISGFTKLTNRLLKERGVEGAEILNNIICRFFEELISIITRHAGDVIKFAGDAVLSIWSSSVSGESLSVLTLRAIACALEQVDKLHNWDTGEGVKLQLHLGLGTGPVRGVDLGNHMRREFVVAGEPLKQLSEAEQQASSGQLVVSPAAWPLRLGLGGCCSGAPQGALRRKPHEHRDRIS